MEKLFHHPIAHLCAEIKEWIPQTAGVGVLKFGCMLPKAPAASKISPKPSTLNPHGPLTLNPQPLDLSPSPL